MKNINNIIKKVLSEMSNDVISEERDPYQFSKVKPLWNKHIKEYVSPAYVDYKSVPEKFIWVEEVDGVWVSKFEPQMDPFNSKQKNYGDKLVENQIFTIPSIVKGQTLYFSDLNQNDIDSRNKITDMKMLGSFNRNEAEKFFGRQCKKLSGNHPKYNVGYNYNIDYYIDNAGNKCYPKAYTENIVDSGGGKTYKQREFNKKVKTTTLKNGNNVDISKNQYDPICKPIEYEKCLKLSWESLSNNNNLSGVYEFVKVNPFYKVKYRALMTEEWFPWYNRFLGYYDVGNTPNPYLTNFQTWSIPRADTELNKTGVEIMEEKLKNFSSGDDDSEYVVDVENFTAAELYDSYIGVEQKNIKDFSTESSHRLVRNVFTYWNEEKKYYSGGYLSSYDDTNDKSELEGLLKDLYGISDKNDKIGFNQSDEEYYVIQDINALEKKYEDIYKQKGTLGTLSTIAKDLQTEKKSKKVSGSTFYENYLKFKWDKTLNDEFLDSLSNVFLDVTGTKFKGCFTVDEISSPLPKALALKIISVSSSKVIAPYKQIDYEQPNFLASVGSALTGGIDYIKKKLNYKDVIKDCPKLIFPKVGICPLPFDYEKLDSSTFSISKGKVCSIDTSPEVILSSTYFKLNNTNISDLGLSVPYTPMNIQNLTSEQLNNSISPKTQEKKGESTPSEEDLKNLLDQIETFNEELSKITSTKFLIFSKSGPKTKPEPSDYKPEKSGYDINSGDYIGPTGLHYPGLGPKW